MRNIKIKVLDKNEKSLDFLENKKNLNILQIHII